MTSINETYKVLISASKKTCQLSHKESEALLKQFNELQEHRQKTKEMWGNNTCTK